MKRRYFIHKFIRYFFIFSLPVLIIGIILSAYSFIEIKKDTNLQAQSTFQIGTELMEEIMTKGDDIAVIFNNSTTVSMSLYKILNQSSLNYKEYVARELISSILENSITNFNYIESIYIYLSNDQNMFYQTDKKVLSLENASDQEWLTLFREQPKDIKNWILRRSFQNFDFEPPHDALSIFRRINYCDGVLVTNLNIGSLSEKLSSIENYPNEAILVTDSQGKILFSNSNADRLSFDPARDIMEQLSEQINAGVCYWENSFPDVHFTNVIYENQPYVLTKFASVNYGLHFLSLVPRRDIYQLLYQIIYCVFFGVAIAAVLCLLFSFYVTNRNFNQIEQLLDVLWQAELGNVPCENASREDITPASFSLSGSRHLDEYNLILNQVIHTFIRNNALTLKVKESELKKTQSELKALQLQINPHFFFNTLQSIDMEILRKEGYSSPASKLIHDLSDILRYALEDSSAPATLQEEIKSAKEYFEIQKFHYPGQIELLWDYEDGILNYQVPRLLFQPLLENSIRYSITTEKDHCLIRIKILEQKDCLRFHILDTGSGMDRNTLVNLRRSLNTEDDTGAHIGLKNTHKRLLLFYPGAQEGLSITSIRSKGTCVSFSIPKIPAHA